MTDATKNADQPRESLLRSFFPRKPLQWAGVVMALGAVAAVGGAVGAASGLVNLSAVAPHPDGWAHLLHFGMERSVAMHADQPDSVEPLDSPAMVVRGAATYAVVCANCHGAPGYGQSPIALSTRPEPPMILDASKHYSDKELFFIVANGVRYTGMPAWSVGNRPDEVWSLVAFIKAMPTMDGPTYDRLAHGDLEDLRRAATVSTTAAHATGAPGTMGAVGDASSISPFIPAKVERPYLAGDPQNPFATPAGVIFPRLGYSVVTEGGNPGVACVSCHNYDGAGRASGSFPNLTLQTPQYLYDALNAFATGQRQSGIMWNIAANLKDADMRSLALEYGSGPAILSRRDGQPKPAPALGADIVAAGLLDGGSPNAAASPSSETTPHVPNGKVERCTSCHLPGVYLGKVIPHLEGQYAPYTRAQLHAFRDGGRGDTGNYDPMVADTHNLTDADITAVADYYAALAPMPKNGAPAAHN